MLNNIHINMATQNKTKKRALTHSDEEDETPSHINWPHFVIISGKGESIPKNPFLIAKSIQAIAGEVKSVKHLRDGNLLVECMKQQQSTNLLKLSNFAGISVTVYPHKSLNSSKGVIRDTERLLQHVAEDEIVEGLASQGVTHVKRFTIKRDGSTINTNTYLLTFSAATLPLKIKAGFNILRVEPYIPNTLRCYKCQKYGHGALNCTNRLLCHRCGDDTHVGSECDNDPKCVNCKGNHMASSKICPVWIRETKITRMKHEKNISFKEARQIVMNTPKTYSSAVKSVNQTIKPISTSSVACQTTITWLHHLNPITSTSTEPGRVLYPSSKVQQTTQTSPLSSSNNRSSSSQLTTNSATSVNSVNLSSESSPSSSTPQSSSSKQSSSISKRVISRNLENKIWYRSFL